jgi:hypothetical protein
MDREKLTFDEFWCRHRNCLSRTLALIAVLEL